MSIGYNRKKKDRKKARSSEHKRIARAISQGEMPRYMFRKVTLEDGRTEILEPRKLEYKTREVTAADGVGTTVERAYKTKGLTMRLVSVIKTLLGD